MAGDDDLLNPDEIEALLNQSLGGGAAPPPKPPAAAPPSATPITPSAPASGELLSQTDLDALFNARGPRPKPQFTPPPGVTPKPASRPAPSKTASRAEALLDQVDADLEAAISGDAGRPGSRRVVSTLEGASPFSLRELGESLPGVDPNSFDVLQDVELDIRIELGRTELLIEDVLQLREGSVVPLDKLAGDPVDVLVNGRLVARGEVLVLNDNFCVRIAEILSPDY